MDLQESIKEYLVDQGLWHESDEVLLEEIIFNIEMMEIAKADIRLNGVQLDVTRDPDKAPFYQKNRCVDVYQMALKNTQGLYRQLVLSPSERQKLKLELMKGEDEFDQAFK